MKNDNLEDLVRNLFFSLVVVAISALVIPVGGVSTTANAQNCADNPDNPFVNCGFETGNFTGWIPQDLSMPFYPLEVNTAGVDIGFGFFISDPTQGVFAVLNGFDGNGPGSISLAQDITVPFGAENLTFDYRCAWDLLNNGDPLFARVFEVNVEESGGGGGEFLSEQIFIAEPGTVAIPDSGGNMQGIVDISEFSGQDVRIVFYWIIPEAFTGPGFCQLDNVNIVGDMQVAQVPALSEWGLFAMAGILGIMGFIAIRRKRLTV